MKMHTLILCGMGALACTAAAQAQSNVDPVNKFAWSENCGWTNWRDSGSPLGSSGVVIGLAYLSGMVWGENVGFINLGNDGPANGFAYANVDGTDFGVNVETDDRLAGLGWGENIGWINFGTFSGLPVAAQARIDRVTGRLRGYAWGENIGWINLDDPDHLVAIRCRADFNSDGSIDFFDYLDFVDAFTSDDQASDINLDGSIDFFDYLDFVDAFTAGC